MKQTVVAGDGSLPPTQTQNTGKKEEDVYLEKMFPNHAKKKESREEPREESREQSKRPSLRFLVTHFHSSSLESHRDT